MPQVDFTLKDIQGLLQTELQKESVKNGRRFTTIDKRLANHDEQFKAVNRRFDIVHAEIKEVRHDMHDLHDKFSVLQSAVDGYAKRMENISEEQVIARHQHNRHDRWIHALADKTVTKLEY